MLLSKNSNYCLSISNLVYLLIFIIISSIFTYLTVFGYNVSIVMKLPKDYRLNYANFVINFNCNKNIAIKKLPSKYGDIIETLGEINFVVKDESSLDYVYTCDLGTTHCKSDTHIGYIFCFKYENLYYNPNNYIYFIAGSCHLYDKYLKKIHCLDYIDTFYKELDVLLPLFFKSASYFAIPFNQLSISFQKKILLETKERVHFLL